MNMNQNEQLRKLSGREREEYGIDRALEIQIKNYLIANYQGADNSTALAEMCAAELDPDDKWLDNLTHPVWDWVIELMPAD